MNERSLPVSAVLAAGVGMGIAGDQLLRAPGAPGLNLLLLFVGLAVSVRIVLRSGGSPLSREASTWIAVGVLAGAALLWRGSELLRLGVCAIEDSTGCVVVAGSAIAPSDGQVI